MLLTPIKPNVHVIALKRCLSYFLAATCLALLFFCLAFQTSTVKGAPATRVSGVIVGDMIKYGQFLSLWASENPDATPAQELLEVNKTASIVNTITDVSGTKVTFKSLTSFRNGTKKEYVADVDVDSGRGIGNITFVSAGLASGDRLYTTGDFSSARINSTFLAAYLSLARETSFLNVTHDSYDVLSGTSTMLWNQYLWDEPTGVLVEQYWEWATIGSLGYGTVASVGYKMIENNIWSGSDPRIKDTSPPVADAGPDQTVDFDKKVLFDAGGSRDDVGIASFHWDFGDGSSDDGMFLTYQYALSGVFNVTLTVVDGKGNSAADSMSVTVVGPPPASSTPALVTIAVILIAGIFFFVWLKRR